MKRRKEKKRKARMEVAQVLHMNGGIGETSYANNSVVQVYIYIYKYKCNNK